MKRAPVRLRPWWATPLLCWYFADSCVHGVRLYIRWREGSFP